MTFHRNQLVFYKGTYALVESFSKDEATYHLEGYAEPIPQDHLQGLSDEDFHSDYFKDLPLELRVINASRYGQKRLLGEMLLNRELALITNEKQKKFLADHRLLVFMLQRLYQAFQPILLPDNLDYLLDFFEQVPPTEEGDVPKPKFKMGKLMKEIPKLPFGRGKLHEIFKSFQPHVLLDLDRAALLELAGRYGMDVNHVVQHFEQQHEQTANVVDKA